MPELRSRELACSPLWLLLLCGLFPTETLASSCEVWSARAESIEGSVEVRTFGFKPWVAVSSGDNFCLGDTVRVLKNSRAALYLNNGTLLRLDEQSVVTFTGEQDEKSFWLKLVKGVGHFISRIKHSFTVVTPFVNAAVEGTEFVVQTTDGGSRVTVFEGQVAAHNELGRITLRSGQSATASGRHAPMLISVMQPRDAVQWALYYPPLLPFDEMALSPAEGKLAAWQEKTAQSVARYQTGDIRGALESISAIGAEPKETRFYLYRAALSLSVGRVEVARQAIQQALRLQQNNASALALQAIIALVNNDKERALQRAKQAVVSDASAVSAQLALSYAQQAYFDLKQARITIEHAVTIHEHDALLWARLAELHLMFGEPEAAQAAAQKAMELAPGLAHTHTVLGFSALTHGDLSAAQQAFTTAIELEQGAPLPRLGLGLLTINRGKLEQGRHYIEVSASLDPNNALIRSYLGKAYFEERRDNLATDQYLMAEQLSPLDPTPWFYQAILEQTLNRPVVALSALNRSIELNDNRAIYRSRLLLDEDRAARTTSLARIYRDLGFKQQAFLESQKSLSRDPTNYSAHRFLADTYAGESRHEIARVSELLQAQLLQPLSLGPIQPQLAESNLALFNEGGSARLSFNEFNRLFVRNGTRLHSNLLVGSNNTWADDFVVSGLNERFSYSVGQFHYETDGFRENNDLTHDIYNAFGQMRVTPRLSLQAELRRKKTAQGDLVLNFDPADFSTVNRRRVTQDTARVGGRYQLSAQSNTIFSYIHSKREGRQQLLSQAPSVVEADDNRSDQIEAQYLFQHEKFNLTTGISAYDVKQKFDSAFDWSAIFGSNCPPFPPVPCGEVGENPRKARSAYLYSNIFTTSKIWNIGFSYDSVEKGALDLNEVSPKIGLQWSLSEQTTLRAAYFETIKKTLTVQQTIEPTQVAGFNQLFDDHNGTQSAFTGLGVDSKINASLFGSVEFYLRDLDVPVFSDTKVTQFNRKEAFYRIQMDWAAYARWAASVRYQQERVSNKAPGPERVETAQVPVKISYFHPNNAFGKLTATHVRQHVTLDSGTSFSSRTEAFFVVDLAIGYRLPNRWGSITLEARNLFDKTFIFQDQNFMRSEPVSYEFIPERTIMTQLSLNI
ncbi:MAG: TonB-dependent receptor [Gammaproteobacteria bacterium]|nr:TonB-dependent receptor [Gammaproteobacteria bacterium]